MEIILYLEVNIVCIAILLSIYLRDVKQRNNDTHHILFTRVLISNVLFFLSDILWGLMSLTQHPHIWQNWIVNIIYFSMSGVTAYFWLNFVEKTIYPEYSCKKKYVFLKMLPVALLIVLSIASVKTEWLFYIDTTGHYQRGSLYILQPLLSYILPIYATARALHAMRKSRSYEKKEQCRSLALFYVLPAIGGISQVIIAGTPMLNVGIAISGLWVYFSFQDNIIMLDPLTAIHNRRSFDKSLEAMLHNYDEESGKHLWLFIMDVDYFKKINDGFGHAEGDRALILIANVLKAVAGEFDCLAARIGGDEFAVCCESEDKTLPEKLMSAISDSLSDKSAACPFKLRMSMGYAEYSEGSTMQQLFISADKQLYEMKKLR